jgi:hypothetical protein
MIEWNGKVMFDNAFSFGTRSAPSFFGRLADLIVHLLKFMSIDDIIKWVDNFVFFRYPNTKTGGRFVYKYDERIFFEVGEELGWIWEASKHTLFSFLFVYIGFCWDMENNTVALPETKRAKYVEMLDKWQVGMLVSRLDTETIVGTLNDCVFVVPQGCSHLVELYRFTAALNSTSSPHIKFKITHKVTADIAWWRDELAKPG